MPIIKSAKKRVKVAEKAAIRNSKTKRTLKTALKAFHKAITGGNKATEEHSKAVSSIDTAAKKGLVHKNKAARQKSQLARAAKVAAVEAPAKAKAAVKKTTAKAADKAPAKKAAAKKPAAKKPTAKKTEK